MNDYPADDDFRRAYEVAGRDHERRAGTQSFDVCKDARNDLDRIKRGRVFGGPRN